MALSLGMGGARNAPNLSHFGELPIVSRTPLIELASVFPLSALRDTVAVAGSGTVTKAAGEYLLATTANGADSASLASAERGRYKPGYSANTGIGLRLPAPLTGNQRATWGYSDDNDGLYFGADASGIFTAARKSGVETVFRQSAWNVDKMDGTGPSRLTLDLTKGNIFQITFSWYGYGVIEFQVVYSDPALPQQVITVHRYAPAQSTSIDMPNLPIRANLANAGTAAARSMYVGGRQFSIVGEYAPSERRTAVKVLGKAAIGTTLVPILSVRRRSTGLSIPVRLGGFDCIVSGDALVEAYINATLTGATFGTIPDVPANETALEQSTAASALTGGTLVYSTLVGASGSGNSRMGSTQAGGLSVDLPGTQPLTLAVRALSGTITASAVARIFEDW